MAVLATWRVTHLLAEEDGPGDLIVRFRALLGASLAGKLMDCFYCLSIWIAAPAALFVTRRPLDCFLNWLALSGGACLLEKITTRPAEPQTMRPPEERGVENVLRFETFATQEHHGIHQPVDGPQR